MFINPLEPPKPIYTGRPIQREAINETQARHQAERILHDNRLTPRARHLVSLLAAFGLLTGAQILDVTGIHERTLRNYYPNHLLDRVRVPCTPFSDAPQIAYSLGMVGMAVADLLFGKGMALSTVGLNEQRMAHALTVNEVALRLSQVAARVGYTPGWRNSLQAAIRRENGEILLAPDGLLSVTRGDGVYRHFWVQIHLEDFASRADGVVAAYEQVRAEGRWRRVLEIDPFPTVLVVFNHPKVIEGYKNALRDVNGNPKADIRVTYLGIAIAAFQRQKFEQWGEVRLGKPVFWLPELDTPPDSPIPKP